MQGTQRNRGKLSTGCTVRTSGLAVSFDLVRGEFADISPVIVLKRTA